VHWYNQITFSLIDQTSGMLLFSPSRSCKIIMAVGVLHNLSLKRRLPLNENLIDIILQDERNFPADNIPAPFRTGYDVRDAFIGRWFS